MLRRLVVGAVIVLPIVGGHPVSATIVVPPNSVCDFLTGGGFIVGRGTSSPHRVPRRISASAAG